MAMSDNIGFNYPESYWSTKVGVSHSAGSFYQCGPFKADIDRLWETFDARSIG